MLDEVDGGVVLMHVNGEDAEEVEGVGVLRIGGADLAVEGFGFREAVGLVVVEGGGEEVMVVDL